MKTATKQIIETFPYLEDKIHSYESILLAGNVLESLTPVEQTFLQLAWFFEDPNTNSFDLTSLMKNLDGEYLELALKLITTYFQNETYLIPKPTYTLVDRNKDDEYFSNTQFAYYLNENGIKYNRQKLNLYYSRGKVPKEDLCIGGKKFWHKNTVNTFLKSEHDRLYEYKDETLIIPEHVHIYDYMILLDKCCSLDDYIQFVERIRKELHDNHYDMFLELYSLVKERSPETLLQLSESDPFYEKMNRMNNDTEK